MILLPNISSGHHIVGFLIPSSGLGDQSFNDMTYAGLIQARNRHQFTLIREQCSDFTEESRKNAMDKLLANKADIIVANGWEYRELVQTYATAHPDQIFLINDIPISGLSNVISTIYGQHEASFLAGALAGLMSKNGKIGFIGGMDIPVIQSFGSGFKQGARHVRPDINIVELFLSSLNETPSGFNNPALGFENANQLYQQGVDIIFSAAGLSGNGIIRAAKTNGKFVIGVDADQDHMAKGLVLTSVMKRLDRATFEILNSIFEGQPLQGVYYFGIKEGGVALSPMTYTHDLIPDDILENLEHLQQQIINGEITVQNPIQYNIRYHKLPH